MNASAYVSKKSRTRSLKPLAKSFYLPETPVSRPFLTFDNAWLPFPQATMTAFNGIVNLANDLLPPIIVKGIKKFRKN